MNPPATSNYDRMRDAMEREFLRYDQARMIDKFSLAHDPSYLYLNFVGRAYRVGRFTGRVETVPGTAGGSLHADYNVSMTVFDVLCASKPDCRPAGVFTALHSVKGLARTVAPGAGLFAREARFFAGRLPQLRAACEALGGRPAPTGDAAYRLALFDLLPVVLQFWDADEEFDAVLKFLWDENILDFMHYETTFFASAHLLSRLIELCAEN